jgi:nanoRNase/pAp phosphatase (c-di-AMP/oligoRNAs hydrolase)
VESESRRNDLELRRAPKLTPVNPVVGDSSLIQTTTMFQDLQRGFEKYRGQSHVVCILGAPDPDAISSAMALGFLAQHHEIDTTIIHFNSVSHYENRALIKKLGVKLIRYDESFDLSQFAIYSIVDSQRGYTPIDVRLHEQEVRFFAFIDHHREDVTPPPAEFVDARQNYQSTAAILSEYLRELYPKGLEPGDPEHVSIATALMHGIRTDTSRFLLATKYDYDAAAYLSPCVDSQSIEGIERKVLTSSTLDILENALVNRVLHDNFIFSDVGYVRATDRDGIPQAAELLLAREGTDTVFVFGIVDEKYIDGSLRTRSETINPDEFLKGFLGVSPESGRYYGGGNVRDKGGFQIPLGFFSLHDDRELIYSMAKAVMEKSFLEYIGKTEKRAMITP